LNQWQSIIAEVTETGIAADVAVMTVKSRMVKRVMAEEACVASAADAVSPI
jgi:hypothetical protein